jgi:multidrug efflux system membrane fusion protein
LSRDGHEQLDEGTVALIDNQIDQTTGTLRVKATLPNRQRTLWPGQFVNMRVLAQVQHQVLTIPASAIERGPDGLFTYRVQADSSVAVAPITTGAASNDVVVVERTQGGRARSGQQPVSPAAGQPHPCEQRPRG